MSFLSFTLTTTIFWAFLLPIIPATAQSCAESKELIQQINKLHVQPLEIDDTFSGRVFREYIDMLNPGHNYLTRQDSMKLLRYADQLDDQIKSNECGFLPITISLFRERVQAMQKFADSLLQQPFSYAIEEGIRPKGNSFESNMPALKMKISKVLKFEILKRSMRLAEAENKELNENNFKSYEVIARQKVRVRQWAVNARLLKNSLEDSYGCTLLRKAICHSYDPHTEYFTDAELSTFTDMLRADRLSFGVELILNSDGDPVVNRLTPGGPAWNSNIISEGDILINFIPLDREPVDFSDLEAWEIEKQLNDPAISAAVLTVKKQDGRLVPATLSKAKIENTENLIESFVLNDKFKIGYIALPGFYTSPQEGDGKGCAGDVAKELIKLKKDGINGLILDLRNNGGGSLQEAIELAGIFIDVGPLALLEETGKAPITLRDQNRGSIYDGPLLVMVNALSASASEIVAACLQDYNRAIVVGCTTYGKATGQVVFPVATTMSYGGSIKVTSTRIFRISGNSLQQTGLIPNITFPEITESIGHLEAEARNSLIPKTVSKKVYFTPLPQISTKTLREKSLQRTGASLEFVAVSSLLDLTEKPIPLSLKSYLRFTTQLNDLATQMHSTVSHLSVNPSGMNLALNQVDSYRQQVSRQTIEEISRSFYIREAFLILSEWLQNKN